MPGPHDGSRARTVRVYLRHHKRDEFNPQPATCSDRPDRGLKGCGASIVFYRTFPGEKRMPFDAPGAFLAPNAKEVVMEDGGVVAEVLNDNVHFATCTTYAGARPPAKGKDTKNAAAGDSTS